MPRKNLHPSLPHRQQGTVLFVSLILLAILTLLGVMLARMQTVELRVALNDQNRDIAMESAEATLRFAEDSLYSGIYNQNSFVSNTAGLYQFQATTQPNAYVNTVNGNPWTTPGAALTGPQLGAKQNPQFIIESLPPVASKCQSISQQQYGRPVPPVEVYRITATSVGGDGTATSELQSIVSGVCQQ